jgi:hypothetical protein
MRNNLLGILLVAALLTSSLWACRSAWMWFTGARQAQALEFNYQRMNNISVAIQSLANEAAEYSKRNPSIDPILIDYNVKPRPAAPAPATQPAPRTTPRP